MPLEHRLNRVPMIIGDAAKEEIRLPVDALRGHIPQQQLGDDLVGAGKIDHPHVGKVDHREGALTRGGEQRFDLRADGRAGGTRHEIGVQLA